MPNTKLIWQLQRKPSWRSPVTPLQDGARVAVMGGGPAGAFFSYFLLAMARRVGLQVQVDIYEGLVQKLAAEGIDLPASVVQRGIDACTLHVDVGAQPLETPAHEKRIAGVYRGGGPLGAAGQAWRSFDGYLLDKALKQGASLLPARIEAVERVDGRVQVHSRRFGAQSYDLLAVAAGVNTGALKLFQTVVPGYRPPATLQIQVAEYRLGAEAVERCVGNSFHVFMLDLPGLDFAGIIPKGEYVTVALLGQAVSPQVFDAFLHTPQVKGCLPPGWQPDQAVCHCSPRINVGAAAHAFADRVIFLGDSGVSRLYKDGIGAAYRAAKAAAITAIFHGVAAEDFRRHVWPVYRRMIFDNAIGKLVFWTIRQLQHRRFARQAMLAMVAHEQPGARGPHTMSSLLWDTFSGSVSYREILLRSLHPAFLARLALHVGVALIARRSLWINRLTERQQASAPEAEL